MTNGEKIGRMTDDELAHFIRIHTDCVLLSSCPAYNNCAEYKGEKTCFEAIVEWLKQECENDG